jgi:hypothetical protein
MRSTAPLPAVPTSSTAPPKEATPATRDVVIDAVRVVAVLTVAVGHALVAAVAWRGGGFVAEHVLGATPWTQWLTFGFQVMPLVFFCGGVANAASLRRGGGFGGWLGSRVERLAGPTLGYTVVAAVALAVGAAAGLAPAAVEVAGRALTMHLWFLAAYTVVLVTTPVAVVAHRRWGLRAVVALVAGGRRRRRARPAHREPAVAWLNLLFVWGGAHQLGVAWQAGALRWTAGAGIALAAAGAALVACLIGFLGYPLSMVSVPGMGATNAGPPSLAMAGLGIVQVGALVAGRHRLGARTSRPGTAARLTSLNAMAMGIYLWHFAAMTIAALVLLPTGLVPDHPTGSLDWWLVRPLWLGGCALVLVALLPVASVLGRRRPVATGVSGLRAVLAALLAAAGFLVLTLGGVAPTSSPLSFPVPGRGAARRRAPRARRWSSTLPDAAQERHGGLRRSGVDGLERWTPATTGQPGRAASPSRHQQADTPRLVSGARVVVVGAG